MKTFPAIICIYTFLLLSCKHEMRPIAYGKDNCEQCRMTVMEPQYAAGMLSSKGKVFTFDSGECLLRYLKSKGIHENETYYVSDYVKPGELIDASKATFLHSDSIQSPMGGHLAAFGSLQSARVTQSKLNGELLTWKELIAKK